MASSHEDHRLPSDETSRAGGRRSSHRGVSSDYLPSPRLVTSRAFALVKGTLWSRLSESNRRPSHYERTARASWTCWSASTTAGNVGIPDTIFGLGAVGGTRAWAVLGARDTGMATGRNSALLSVGRDVPLSSTRGSAARSAAIDGHHWHCAADLRKRVDEPWARTTADDPPATHLPRTNWSLARLRIALVFAERGFPVLATVEDAEDVDHELAGRLIHLVGDEGLLLEGARPQARADVVARSASEREHQDAVDVVEDRRHEAPSGVRRCLLGDPLVDSMELL